MCVISVYGLVVWVSSEFAGDKLEREQCMCVWLLFYLIFRSGDGCFGAGGVHRHVGGIAGVGLVMHVCVYVSAVVCVFGVWVWVCLVVGMCGVVYQCVLCVHGGVWWSPELAGELEREKVGSVLCVGVRSWIRQGLCRRLMVCSVQASWVFRLRGCVSVVSGKTAKQKNKRRKKKKREKERRKRKRKQKLHTPSQGKSKTHLAVSGKSRKGRISNSTNIYI